jgi:hypothetical protein
MTGHAPAGRTPPRRVVTVDRMVVVGVPAAGLDPRSVSASLTAVLPELLAGRLGEALPSGRCAVAAVRLAWSPSAGTDALGRVLADGVAHALRTARHD